MENFAERLAKLEREIENIKKQLRKKAEKQKLTLQEKFDIHDRAKNLVAEFESMQVDTWAVTEFHRNELKTIIKCFKELIDHSLGVEFP